MEVLILGVVQIKWLHTSVYVPDGGWDVSLGKTHTGLSKSSTCCQHAWEPSLRSNFFNGHQVTKEIHYLDERSNNACSLAVYGIHRSSFSKECRPVHILL